MMDGCNNCNECAACGTNNQEIIQDLDTERDQLRAEVKRLREALKNIVSHPDRAFAYDQTCDCAFCQAETALRGGESG